MFLAELEESPLLLQIGWDLQVFALSLVQRSEKLLRDTVCLLSSLQALHSLSWRLPVVVEQIMGVDRAAQVLG